MRGGAAGKGEDVGARDSLVVDAHGEEVVPAVVLVDKQPDGYGRAVSVRVASVRDAAAGDVERCEREDAGVLAAVADEEGVRAVLEESQQIRCNFRYACRRRNGIYLEVPCASRICRNDT